MGTTWSTRFVGPEGVDAAAVTAMLTAELDGVIAEMSVWEPGSAISRFNAAPAGRWQALPPRFFEVLQAGLKIAEESGGAFDPAAGALVDLWGFGPAPARLAPPSASEIAAARTPGDGRAIRLDIHARRARQPGGIRLDLSGIAKGHAVDRLAGRMAQAGFPHALIEIGGELRGDGVKPDGQPWWVDLELPPGAVLPPVRIALHGLSVATSGDYRRYFAFEGKRYAHNIDPRTGAPADNGLASVTVLHRECMMADAYATALYVLGPEEGLGLAERLGLPALFVARQADRFVETMSRAFAAMLA